MKKALEIQQTISRCGLAVFDLDPSMVPKQVSNDNRLAIILLCTAGEAWVEFNMEILHITPRSRVCFSNLMLSNYNRMSDDFAATVLSFDATFAQEASASIAFEQLLPVFEQPVASVTDDGDWLLLCRLAEALRAHCQTVDLPNSHEVGLTLTMTLLHALSGIAMRNKAMMPRQMGMTQADVYFRSFVDDVSNNITTQHEVAFYASRLNLSPKYLSDVCKRKSGRTAKDVISGILVARLKRELMMTSKSMKELAAEYGFADQSSLGKFFRKAVGLSPMTFKQDHGNPEAQP